MKTGDKVIIETDGRVVPGEIVFASSNGVSLILAFEAILHGHVAMMPVLLSTSGTYRTLAGDHEVIVRVPS